MSSAFIPKILPDPDGFKTPPPQNSPKAVQGVDKKLVVWLQSVKFFANSGSIDDLKRIAELAKNIPDSTNPSVRKAISAVVDREVLDCSDLVAAVTESILKMGIRECAPDDVFRALSPIFFSQSKI